jgi:response regulator RpfG family c-di-GMP phosphodiesterase
VGKVGRRLRILLVDDEPEFLRALAWELEDVAEVTSTDSVSGALELFAKEGYDIVVADLRLPDRWGDELLAHVAAMSPDTQRLLLTADQNPQQTVRELIDLGVIQAAFSKPGARGLIAKIKNQTAPH